MTVTTMPAAAPAPVLMLGYGEGPWSWRATRYELLDGALDQATTWYSQETINKLRSLGTE